MEITHHDDHTRYHYSPSHGVRITHDENGLHMHAWKVWHVAVPSRLLAQTCTLKAAKEFAANICAAIDDERTR